MNREMAFAIFRSRAIAATSAAALLGVGSIAWSQASDEAGPLGRITASQQLVWEDDRDLYGVTSLSAQLQAQTRIQTFRLSISGDIEEEFGGDNSGTDLVSPEARLFYLREGAQSELNLGLAYQRQDIDRLTFDDTEEFLTLSKGKATTKSGSLKFAFGKESKFGGVLNLSHLSREYSGAGSRNLSDYDTDYAELALNFQLSPVITLGTTASLRDTDNADPLSLDNRTTRAGASLTMQLDQRTVANLGVSQTEVRRENSLGSIETRGLSYSAGLSREVSLGKWTVDASSSFGTVGRRDTLKFGRNFEGARYDLAFSAGATRLEDGDWDPVYSLSYRRELMREARLAVNLNRASTSDNNGDEALSTSLSASYRQPLSEASQLNTSFGYRRTDVQSGSGTDAEKYNFRISYDHELTRDWGFSAGYEGSRSKSGNTETDEDLVFLGLTRTYLWRP